jgi:magnesium-transporting ATPase (P-type)
VPPSTEDEAAAEHPGVIGRLLFCNSHAATATAASLCHLHLSDNLIQTTKYTFLTFLPRFLFAQYTKASNIFFLVVCVLNCVPMLAVISPITSIMPVCFVLIVAAAREIVEDLQKRRSDLEANSRPVEIIRDGEVHTLPAHSLRPGDLVAVREGEEIPADLVAISVVGHASEGFAPAAYIQTANLDGETNLKTRHAVSLTASSITLPALKALRLAVDAEPPSNRIHSFHAVGAIYNPDVVSVGSSPDARPPLSETGLKSWLSSRLTRRFGPAHFPTARVSASSRMSRLLTLPFRSGRAHRAAEAERRERAARQACARHFAPALGAKVPIGVESFLLRGSKLVNTPAVWGMVMYAGHDTRQLANCADPPQKVTHLDRRLNLLFVGVIVVDVFCVMLAVGNALGWKETGPITAHWYLGNMDSASGVNYLQNPHNPLSLVLTFLIYFILLNWCVPMSLMVSLELVRFLQAQQIEADDHLAERDPDTGRLVKTGPRRPKAASSGLTDDLGCIEAVFTDKTGTLTENKMVFQRGCVIVPAPDGITSDLVRFVSADAFDGDEPDDPAVAVPYSSSLRLDGPVSDPHLLKAAASSAQLVLKLFALCNDVQPQPATVTRGHSAPGARVKKTRRAYPLKVLSRLKLGKRPQDRVSRKRGVGLDSTATLHLRIRRPFKTTSPSQKHSPELVAGYVSIAGDAAPSQASMSVAEDPFSVATITSASFSSAAPSAGGPGPVSAPAGLPPLVIAHGPSDAPSAPSEAQDMSVTYCGTSPDEVALVTAAAEDGIVLLSRSVGEVVLSEDGSQSPPFSLLLTVPFDSDRKRMSVVVRDEAGRALVLCKGADSHLLPLCTGIARTGHPAAGALPPVSVMPADASAAVGASLHAFASSGLRVLVLAAKEISTEEADSLSDDWNRARLLQTETDRDVAFAAVAARVETDLGLLGTSAIEDKLQAGVPETLQALRDASISVWMLTGDATATAVNIGRSSRLIRPGDEVTVVSEDTDLNEASVIAELRALSARSAPTAHSSPPQVLVLDGTALRIAMHDAAYPAFLAAVEHTVAVICCRVSPLQKALVVSAARDDLRLSTLAIGDGSNDVAMIQSAHVGVGIAGREGLQASQSADFSICQFQFLQRLLFVHGRYSLIRNAELILYSVYKNFLLCGPLFLFGLASGWSGQSMMDSWFLLVFNTFYTAVPIAILALTERDVPTETAMGFPSLYRPIRTLPVFSLKIVLLWTAETMWHSLLLYFIPVFALGAGTIQADGTSAGMWFLGHIYAIPCMLIATARLLLNSRMWNAPFHIWTWFSLAFFFAFSYFISNGPFPTMDPQQVDVPPRVMASVGAWAAIAGCTVAAILPSFTFRVLRRQFHPTAPEAVAVAHTAILKQERDVRPRRSPSDAYQGPPLL